MRPATRRCERHGMATLLHRPAGLAAALLLSLTAVAGCGSDGSDAADASDGFAASAPPAGDAPINADASLGESVQGAVDALGGDGVTDALGRSLSSVLDGATGYEVADGRLLVDLDKTAAEGTSTCLIATTARDGVGADVPISLRFTDETVACD